MCMLNRLTMILFVAYVCINGPIWIEIPLFIAFAVCGWFADKEEVEMQEKIKNHNLRIQSNEDYIAEISKRLDKLENKINKGE